MLAKHALSQLSYAPKNNLVGPSGLEPLTPVLSGLCSNQLSYGPELFVCVMYKVMGNALIITITRINIKQTRSIKPMLALFDVGEQSLKRIK